MSCQLEKTKPGWTAPDWKAYVLGELDAEAVRDAEAHAAACGDCQNELANLSMTMDGLAMLREEEAPRRIAFVSDKIFEQRWWQKIGQTFMSPAFAGAAVIAAAILVHGFARPMSSMNPGEIAKQSAVVSTVPAGQVDPTAIEARVTQKITEEVTKHLQDQMAATMTASVDASIHDAVVKAVAETRQQDDRRTTLLLAAAERRYAETTEFLNKQVTRIYALNSGAGVR